MANCTTTISLMAHTPRLLDKNPCTLKKLPVSSALGHPPTKPQPIMKTACPCKDITTSRTSFYKPPTHSGNYFKGYLKITVAGSAISIIIKLLFNKRLGYA